MHDIAVHPRDNDLIIGTHGRGVWIMDDISFLQEMTDEVLSSPVHLFQTRPATAHYQSAKRESFTKPIFAARNPLFGLAVTAYFRVKPKERPRVSILDKENQAVFEINFMLKEGILRDFWNLQTIPRTKEGTKITPSALGVVALPLVAPGEYTVEMDVDGQKFSAPATVLPDTRLEMTATDREAQHQALAEILALSKKLGLAVTAATNIRRQLEGLEPELKKGGQAGPSAETAVQAFSEKFRAIEERVVPGDIASTSMTREIALRGGPINQQVLMLGMSIAGFPAAPTQTELFHLEQVKQVVDALVGELNGVIREDIPALNQTLEQGKLKLLKAPEEVKL
jgi:hypothetical protein